MHSNSVSERRILWNETLNACGSRGFLNSASSKDFKSFINTYDLLEYHLHGHRYTWCRGSSMSRIDRAFASPACHRQFPDMVLTRFSRGLSNHCQLVLGPTTQNWGWKPFRFFNGWVYHLRFMKGSEEFWRESCRQFPGRFSLVEKLSYVAIKLRGWNKMVFGNEDNR